MRISPIKNLTSMILFNNDRHSKREIKITQQNEKHQEKTYNATIIPFRGIKNINYETYFKELGCQVKRNPDSTLTVLSDTKIELTTEQINKMHISKIDGDLTLTDCGWRSEIIPSLKEVTGKLTIEDNKSGCISDEIIFKKLEEVGSIDINSGRILKFLTLKKINGNLNISANADVTMNHIKSISGDFNVNKTWASINSSVINAVQGKINSNPPKKDITVIVYDDNPKEAEDTELIFKSNGDIVKL